MSNNATLKLINNAEKAEKRLAELKTKVTYETFLLFFLFDTYNRIFIRLD